MSSSVISPSDKTEQLADAFRVFSELSEHLSGSYRSLEKQVAKLHAELVAARSERLKTLLEKEGLAVRLQQILAALPAAVIVIDAAGIVTEYNATASELFGEPLAGLSWFEVADRNLTPVIDSPHERQLSDGRRVSIIVSTLAQDSGQIVLLSDVSDMRALQDRLNRQKHLSAMGEMVAGLAHQVRTPLSTAVLYASHLSRPDLDEVKRLRFSAKILERLHYLERQVNDMLIYAREGRLAIAAFTLSEFISNVNEAMCERIVAGGIVFRIVDQAEVPLLSGNENALRGVVMNLLNNAVEACSGRGNIELRFARSGGDTLLITVEDDGSGIDQAALARVFEPFYTTKSTGTGLGLAVVESVVRAHGGSVSCRSKAGKGSVFTLVLPIVTEPSGRLQSTSQASSHREEKGFETV